MKQVTHHGTMSTCGSSGPHPRGRSNIDDMCALGQAKSACVSSAGPLRWDVPGPSLHRIRCKMAPPTRRLRTSHGAQRHTHRHALMCTPCFFSCHGVAVWRLWVPAQAVAWPSRGEPGSRALLAKRKRPPKATRRARSAHFGEGWGIAQGRRKRPGRGAQARPGYNKKPTQGLRNTPVCERIRATATTEKLPPEPQRRSATSRVEAKGNHCTTPDADLSSD